MFRHAAAGVVVEERRRLGIRPVAVVVKVLEAGTHSRCGALCWHISRNGFDRSRLLQPVEAQVGDDVGDIAGMLRPRPYGSSGVVVDALAGRMCHSSKPVGSLTRCHLPMIAVW